MTFHRMRRLLSLLLAFCALPAATYAQERVNPRETARVRLGPLFLSPSLRITDVGVDTNVFNEFENPKSDFTYTVVPAVDLWVPVTRRFLLTTRTELGVSYFQRYSDQRAVNPRSLVRGDILLTRLTMFGENDFRWSKERANVEIDDRVRQRDNQTRAGFGYEVTSKFSAEVSAYQRTIDFEADFSSIRAINYRAALKRNERGVRVAFTHRLTSRTSLLLEGETQRVRFDFARVKNADGFRIMPGVRFTPRALIGGTAKVGFRRLSPLDERVPEFQGLVASLSLGYTLRGATRFTFETSRDLMFSYEVSRPYFIATAVGGNIRRQVRGRFDVVLGVNRSRQAYRALADASVPPRTDVVLRYSADIGYRLSRDVRMGVVMAWQRRDAPAVASRAYRGFRAGLSLTVWESN